MWLLNKFLEGGGSGKDEPMEVCVPIVPKPQAVNMQEEKFNGKNIVFLDIETQKSAAEVGGWNNKHLMKIACIVIYSTKEGKYIGYTEDKVKDCVDEILKADMVVGFNIKSFDWAVLAPYTGIDLNKIKTLDLLEAVKEQLKFRLSLDHLSMATLKKGKTADGLQSLQWYKEGKIEQILEYCQDDVQLTKELFEYALLNKHLLYVTKEGQTLQIPIDLNKYI